MKSKQKICDYTPILTMITLTLFIGGSSFKNVLSSSKTKNLNASSSSTVQPLRTLPKNLTWIYAVAISPNGKFLASGSYNKKIEIWHQPR